VQYLRHERDSIINQAGLASRSDLDRLAALNSDISILDNASQLSLSSKFLEILNCNQ